MKRLMTALTIMVALFLSLPANATDRKVGDSIAEGSGATSIATSWANQVAGLLGTTIVDVAHGGDMVPDAVAKMFAQNVVAGDRTWIYLRTNDQRVYGVNAAKQAYSDNGLRALLVWYATGTKTKAINGGAESGSSWTNTVIHGVGRRATTVGDSKTFTVSAGATVAYLSALSATGSGCSYHVKKNGALIGTYASDTPGAATYNGYHYNNRLHRITGVTGGDAITYEMAAPSYCYIEWFADNNQSVKPKVFVGTTIKASPAAGCGYSQWGGSLANVQSYNASLTTIVSELQADGLDITLMDFYSALNDSITQPGGDLHAGSPCDGIHPTQSGHDKMRDVAWAAYQGGGGTPPPPTITYSSAGAFKRLSNGTHDGTFWIDGGGGCPGSTCKQLSIVP